MEDPEPSKKRKAEEITENGEAEGEKKDDDNDTMKAAPQPQDADVNGTSAENVEEEKKGSEDGKETESKPEEKNREEKTDGEKVEESTEQKKMESSGDEPQHYSKPITESQDTSQGSNPYDKLKYVVVRNDGKPESMIKLVGLKSLFAKQLPKMPRAYIARLVFDRRHVSLAILSDDPAVKDSDEEIIGAICFRPFEEMRFAEIAFCAVNASHQVKGYGTKLMNLVKQLGAEQGIEYFITYADNYAIGYFKKQGFTKSISMPKGRYTGLIKDYDGGTMMECYVHPSIDFTRIPEMIKAQRQFILDRIRLKANSHKVYDPLPKDFNPNVEGVSRVNESAAKAMAIPGMAAAGWTLSDLMASTGQGKDADRQKNVLKNDLLAIVRKIEEQQFAWPFREPVDTTEVTDYLDVIKEPIDLSTIDKRIRKGDHYKSKKMLYSDLMMMVNNCKLYNDEKSTYVQCAGSLEKFLSNLFMDS